MGYIELDMNLSDEAKAIQKEVYKFGMEVLRPAGIELDKLHDPTDVFSKDSIYWDVVKAYREMNLHMAGIPKELGGMAGDVDPKVGMLISEILGYADAGLTIGLGVSSMPFTLASMSPEPELQQLARDYCNDASGELIGCWAGTEPAHGSDIIFATTSGFDDPKCGFDVKAELKGDEYIINGQKASWVSNGTFATHAALHLTLDPTKGMYGSGVAIVPLDLPGISRGKPLDKIGQRPLNQGEIFFDDVKIPKSHMLIADPQMGHIMIKTLLIGGNTGMGELFTGLAQAAFDEALKYAKERIQGGIPIFEHKNIKLQLFNMFIKVEAARALARRVSLYNTTNEPRSYSYAVASKVLSTKNAFEVTSEAIQIFGGNGLSKEYVIEKLFRDAKAAMIEDGENNSLSLAGADELP